MLDQVLDRVAYQIEKETAIKRRVKGAMIYPMVVITFASLVLVGMLMFIVPIFVNIFKELGGSAADADPVRHERVEPAAPRLVHHLPRRRRDHLRASLRRRARSPAGASGTAFKLRVPMKIGDTVRKVAMARFSRTLATLVGAGVDIIKALEITGTPRATG